MAEQALIQSEKLAVVGRLASSIAHEINNPLEAITNLLYLARNSENIADIHRHLHTAEIELRRVSAITSQTLRFHKQATRPQDVTVKQLMQSVLSIYQGRIANSRVRITQRTRTSQPVRCFEGEIRQIISNLIGNALDAMSENGHLFLRSRLGTNWINREHGIVITIADTGVGMSAETMAKLFNPFFTTKGMTGTGLGLWVSKEIIGRHRGLLRVRSSQSATHHGTVFNIFLPFDAVVR
jgi:C4-dicarboxylate-specific signal transduction histidine kinase